MRRNDTSLGSKTSKWWKCGACEVFVCKRCHAPKAQRDDPEHICDAQDVQTAELLMKETKPCPSCAAPIFKIDGCDQMWCTACHTPFSWRTQRVIVTAVLHNPHYIHWRQRQRDAADARRRHRQAGGAEAACSQRLGGHAATGSTTCE